MNLFRRSQTPEDAPRPEPDTHGVILDLIEQLAMLKGQVGAMEVQWDEIKAQIRKGYQRMEKAYQRLEEAGLEDSEPSQASSVSVPLVGFAKKLEQMNKKGA